MFDRDEIVRALRERGFDDVRQRIAGLTQFVGGRLPSERTLLRGGERPATARAAAPARSITIRATRSRCQRESPNITASAVARFRNRWRSCSHVKPMPPWT